MDTILVSRKDDVLAITLDRPAVRNAVDMAMFRELARLFALAERTPDVGAVLIMGAGEGFCAGHDLQAFSAWPQHASDPVPAFLHALAAFSKPFVAAVHGCAVGIGATMLLHADWVVAEPGTRMRLPFIDLEIGPEAGSSLLLPAWVGMGRARRLLLGGEPFTARDAHEWGWIAELGECDGLHETAHARAAMLAAKPPATYAAIKRRLVDPYAVRARIDEEIELINTALARRARSQA